MNASLSDSLAWQLALLEGKLSDLRETYSAMMAARALVTDALHTGNKAHDQNGGRFFDPSSIYHLGYQSLEFITRTACSEIVDACRLFNNAAKADPVLLAQLEAIHAKTPLGPVWSGEEYPAA